jgi:hypothetical protein
MCTQKEYYNEIVLNFIKLSEKIKTFKIPESLKRVLKIVNNNTSKTKQTSGTSTHKQKFKA